MESIHGSHRVGFQHNYTRVDDLGSQIDDDDITHVLGKTLFRPAILLSGKALLAELPVQSGNNFRNADDT